jgi:hypothetical protein
MAKRGNYNKTGFYQHNGASVSYEGGMIASHGDTIYGLKRRPDERFYCSFVPSKTFGKTPLIALRRYYEWLEVKWEERFGEPAPSKLMREATDEKELPPSPSNWMHDGFRSLVNAVDPDQRAGPDGKRWVSDLPDIGGPPLA